jgi:hypothetical protein
MLIKNLSKEIDAKDMTAVHGGSADSQVWIPIYNGVSQGNSNAVAGNAGPVQIDNNNSATESTAVSVPTNYGAILDLGGLVRKLLPSL